MIRVAIGVPSTDMVHADFAFSLYRMSVTTTIYGIQTFVLNERGALLSVSRNKIVEQALKARASHLLFLDSDMTFPAGTLAQLLNRDMPVVWAGYPKRVKPFTPVCKPDELATGCMLVDMEVFRHKIDAPWFKVDWDGKTYVGEDLYFKKILDKARIPVYLDKMLSKEIGHVGIHEHKLKRGL